MINMKFVSALFFLSFSLLNGSNGLLKYNSRLHGPLPFIVQKSNIDSIEVSQDTSIYPARGLALSLAIPGMGQWYAGANPVYSNSEIDYIDEKVIFCIRLITYPIH